MLRYESDHFGENNLFSDYHNYNFNFPKHLHRSFELLYVSEGSIEVSICKRNFTVHKNQCLLILPYEIHSFSTNEYSDSYICVFSPEYVKTFHNMIYGKYINQPVFNLSNEMQDLLLDKIFKDNDDLLEMKGCLYLICSQLLRNSPLIDNIKTDYELLHQVLNYIQENFTDDISLQDIAARFGYSYTYLSKYLNTILDMSFTDFINQNRINYASYLLKNSESTITDIAYICGYSSIRSFNRNFLKIMRTTPKAYRNEDTDLQR